MAQITTQTAQHHEDLYLVLQSILADLAALKVAVDTNKVAVDELIDDHATFKTISTDNKTAIAAIITAAATNIAAVAAVTPVSSSSPATLSASKPTAVGALGTTN